VDDPGRRIARLPALGALALIGAIGTIGGFSARRPDLVAFASAPLVTSAAAVMLGGERRGSIADVGLRIDADRMPIGGTLRVTVTLSPRHGDLGRADLAIALPAGAVVVDGSAVIALSARRGEVAEHSFTVRPTRLGRAVFGPVVVRTADGMGLLRSEEIAAETVRAQIVPGPVTMGALLDAATTGAHIGEQMSRHVGDGFELADIRPWSPGDAARDIHWRATARVGEPHVLLRRPERNRDVIVVIDANADEADPSIPGDPGTVQACMTVAAAVAAAHAAGRDRVGVLGLGEWLSWVLPGSGARTARSVVEAVVDVAVSTSPVHRTLSAIPVRARPQGALYIVATPLADGRGVHLVDDLARSGHDTVALVVTPTRLRDRLADPVTAMEALMHRATIRRVQHAGALAVEWHPGDAVEPTVREVIAWRRRTRRPGAGARWS
jgi:uncharacterized protein (DUF58 family)